MVRAPCCEGPLVKKGPWTPEEDILLASYVKKNGPGNWRAVSTNTGLLRCSKSCRLRWTNYLRPGIKRGNFSGEEEKLIVHLQALLGNRWAAIASFMPERTDNDIKNHWNTHLKKRLQRTEAGGAAGCGVDRGLWERRLQNDGVIMAEKALREALSAENSVDPSVSDGAQLEASSSTAGYACYSEENISRLLQEWSNSGGSGGGAASETQDMSTDQRESSEMSFFPQVDEIASSLLDSWLLDEAFGQPPAHFMVFSPGDYSHFF